MSAMDGICDVSDLIKQAAKWGHKAIAITDHVAVQSFPDAQRCQAKLKKEKNNWIELIISYLFQFIQIGKQVIV